MARTYLLIYKTSIVHGIEIQARPQHVSSPILAGFGPDIHVSRVKNRISHILPGPEGSPGQSVLELWIWILKNLIKVGCPSRFKSFLSDF